MGYYKTKKKQGFCFCLGLRPGVIISSVLWMMEGIFLSLMFMFKFIDNRMITYVQNQSQTLTVFLSVHFISLFFISLFGLISLVVYKSIPFFRLYSNVSWFSAVLINSLLVTITIIMLAVNNNYCKSVQGQRDCTTDLIWLSVIIFFQLFLHTYFSFVSRTYAIGMEKQRTERIKRNGSPQISIRIDKQFDHSDSL